MLAHLEWVTPRRAHALAWEEGTARGLLRAVARGRGGSAGDRATSRGVRPEEVRRRLAEAAARHVTPGDAEYPARLEDLPDPPASLFARGRPLPEGPSVAVVGARRCTPYGEEVAEAIGRGVAAAGIPVISGAATGIDSAAHRGALRAGGPTIAVLGSGIDVAYPAGNRSLIDDVAAAGTVVSEYPPGFEARPYRFPARNRLVAGLAAAVVVVEGAAGSGSMITAEIALDLGREVLAVPGPVTSPLSSVPHQLLREGAGLAEGPDDVLATLGLAVLPPEAARASEEGVREGGDGPVSGAGAPAPPGRAVSEEERELLGHLAGAPVPVDVLAVRAGVPVSRALAALAGLELLGLVREVAGRYERTARAGAGQGLRHRGQGAGSRRGGTKRGGDPRPGEEGVDRASSGGRSRRRPAAASGRGESRSPAHHGRAPSGPSGGSGRPTGGSPPPAPPRGAGGGRALRRGATASA